MQLLTTTHRHTPKLMVVEWRSLVLSSVDYSRTPLAALIPVRYFANHLLRRGDGLGDE